MKFGLIVVPAVPAGHPEPFDDILEQAQLLDEAGFECMWLSESHFTDYARPGLEVVASAALARTERLRVGSAITTLPFHHPLRVAESWAVLDHIGHGRVDLGVGRGYRPVEFDGFGVPMDQARERYAESLDIIQKAWTGEPFAYDGEFWQFPELSVFPKPFQAPGPPIWGAAVSAPSVKQCVDMGLNGLVGPYLCPPEMLKREYFDVWHELVAQSRTPDLQMAHNELVFVGESDAQVRADIEEALMWYVRRVAAVGSVKDPNKAASQYKDYSAFTERYASMTFDEVYDDLAICGTPDVVTEKLRWLRDEGRCDYIINFMQFGGLSHEKAMRSIKLFAEEVMPRLQ